jgi:DNA-binding helix-hairpin-helix protein with protein kinase domain
MKIGTMHEVVDGDGQPCLLGELIGKGGEGTVYAVDGRPTLAVKIFHRQPLDPETVEKLQAMIAAGDLSGVAAWPRSIVCSAVDNRPCGLLVSRVSGARHLHELYSAYPRRRYFPQARWRHLVTAARNVAAAFERLHSAGIVVGDVNQGNLLVDDSMRVRFIDCDSFQIEAAGRLFPCPVGTPHFTPPELHGVKLREVRRTLDHDRFGMATLIFHLLFVGRHPFAGRFFGDGELTIERAILERRFAFSAHQRATLMEPPPASLRLSDLPPALGEMFEKAFRQADDVEQRPDARQWVEQLDLLLRECQSCSFDPAHQFYARASECPWCRIEDEGGPAFFVLDGSSSIISPKRIEHLETQLRRLAIPTFPPLAQAQIKIPQAIAPKRLKKYGPLTGAAFGAAALIGSGAIALAAPFTPWALLAGSIGAVASGAFLLASGDARAKRRADDQLAQQLADVQADLAKKTRSIAGAHAQRKTAYDKLVAELKTEAAHYQAADGQLTDVLAVIRRAEQNRYLAGKLIQEHIRDIPGMTPALAAVLQSYGIESPLDIDSIRLIGVPMLHDGLALELIAWRDRVARQFTYKAPQGLTAAEAERDGKTAVARFKLSQARRILTASRQLDALARSHAQRLARELAYYDRCAEPARQLAKDLRDLRTARRQWELAINRTPATIAVAALAGPVAGALLYWLFG